MGRRRFIENDDDILVELLINDCNSQSCLAIIPIKVFYSSHKNNVILLFFSKFYVNYYITFYSIFVNIL